MRGVALRGSWSVSKGAACLPKHVRGNCGRLFGRAYEDFFYIMIIVSDEEVNEQSFPSDVLGGVKVSKPGDKSIQPGASGERHFG